MGDRTSIQFKKGKDVSVAFFHHWGGLDIVQEAIDYAKELKEERSGGMMPIDRFEPNTVMIDFIRVITAGQKRIESSLYLGKDETDGDNSDNGNWIIDFDELEKVQEDLNKRRD